MPSLLVCAFSVPVSRSSWRVPKAQPLVESFIAEMGITMSLHVHLRLCSLDTGNVGFSSASLWDCFIPMQRAVPWQQASSEGVTPMLSNVGSGPRGCGVGRKTPPRVTRNGVLTHLAPEGLALWLTALCNTQRPGACARKESMHARSGVSILLISSVSEHHAHRASQASPRI